MVFSKQEWRTTALMTVRSMIKRSGKSARAYADRDSSQPIFLGFIPAVISSNNAIPRTYRVLDGSRHDHHSSPYDRAPCCVQKSREIHAELKEEFIALLHIIKGYVQMTITGKQRALELTEEQYTVYKQTLRVYYKSLLGSRNVIYWLVADEFLQVCLGFVSFAIVVLLLLLLHPVSKFDGMEFDGHCPIRVYYFGALSKHWDPVFQALSHRRRLD